MSGKDRRSARLQQQPPPPPPPAKQRSTFEIGINRDAYYKFSHGSYSFQNPIFNEKSEENKFDFEEDIPFDMRLKDFLVSIPSFQDFSEQQLLLLERRATVVKFKSGEVLFRQGQEGDVFYVCHSGSVDILIQDNPKSLKAGDFGNVVNRLTEGCYFGERALMTSEPRAATVKANCDTVCLVFSRETFEEAISGSNALLGNDVNDNVDWSKDDATRSLYKHIEKILQLKKMNIPPKSRRVLYELTTAFTPELSTDEVMARMVMTVRVALKGDRVGLFVLTEDRKSMILKVSERSKGIKLPIKGLAGVVIETNENLNILDAYEDERFDSAMDRRTGYRTRQVLGVPVRHPLTDEALGLLQVNNRVNGSLEKFTEEEEDFLMLAAEQLSELIHGRADIIAEHSEGSKPSDSAGLVNTADVSTPFQVELFSFNFFHGDYVDPSFKYFEVKVSMHLALNELCTPRSVVVEIPAAGKNAKVTLGGEIVLDINSRIVFNISTRDVPRAARILFRVSGSKKKKGPFSPVGWAAAPVFDFKGTVDTQLSVRLFEGENNVPINTTLSNNRNPRAPTIAAVLCADIVLVDNASSSINIVHTMPLPAPFQAKVENFSPSDSREISRILLLSFNPMSQDLLTAEDKEFLWSIRHNILEKPELLAAFLMCVQWQNAEHVSEVYEILDLWEPPIPTQAMQLLDRRFMDPKVRAFAVHCLEELQDEELQLYMLQLCQQIKFENYADSALSRFLLRRALKNMRVIGHMFFWQLQSEVHDLDVRERFTILLQIYIRNCDDHRIELGHQMFVMKRLEHVAETVLTGESKVERLSILKEQLRTTVLPKEFQLPLNPHLRVKGIEVEECKVMESKKKPLWLVMHDCDTTKPNVVLMLKVGDDLRQDILILQLLRVMDDMWKKEGLDMSMMLYGCISTGHERGLLQVVLNATTVGRILSEAAYKKSSGKLSRKFGSALKALNDFDHLRDYIIDQSHKAVGYEAESSIQEAEVAKRTRNFIISAAAYCVASYVLGLGDRHNDNLMMTKFGHYFHIDFGHILGNFKYKLGVKRERAPFVFTYAMKKVMTEKQYEEFSDLCCDAYNILRENSMLLVSLCSLAIPCNLPELQKEADVLWIYEKLLVGASDEDAAKHFRAELHIALNTTGTRLNDAAHMIAHY